MWGMTYKKKVVHMELGLRLFLTYLVKAEQILQIKLSFLDILIQRLDNLYFKGGSQMTLIIFQV